ncbi:KDEL motif-containing protein 2 [Exaiptasia diaphana]|nr:KDEL motif-containing protein 2 [Exaiptasia diaphana]
MMLFYRRDISSFKQLIHKEENGVYHEGCYCPQEEPVHWETALNCPMNYTQINRDLYNFPKINLKRLAKEGVDRFGIHNALCHYSVVNNKRKYPYVHMRFTVRRFE